MFCEESLGEINGKDVKIFQNGWVHESYCLKALIALEQVNTFEVGQKKEKSGSIPPCSRKQVAPKYRDVRFNVTDSPPPPSPFPPRKLVKCHIVNVCEVISAI